MQQGIYQQALTKNPLLGAFFAGFDTPDILIDARHLSCPMPLLKIKMALKQPLHCLYIITTDPNAGTDLARFCQKNGLCYDGFQSDEPDTFCHRILTKKTGI